MYVLNQPLHDRTSKRSGRVQIAARLAKDDGHPVLEVLLDATICVGGDVVRLLLGGALAGVVDDDETELLLHAPRGELKSRTVAGMSEGTG